MSARRTYWPCQLCRAHDGKRAPQAVGTVAGIRVCQRHLERVRRINRDATRRRLRTAENRNSVQTEVRDLTAVTRELSGIAQATDAPLWSSHSTTLSRNL